MKTVSGVYGNIGIAEAIQPTLTFKTYSRINSGMFRSIATLLGTSSYEIIVIEPAMLSAWLDPMRMLERYRAGWILFCTSVKVNVNWEEHIYSERFW